MGTQLGRIEIMTQGSKTKHTEHKTRDCQNETGNTKTQIQHVARHMAGREERT